ncbi:hypothetical protein L6164_013464 [Bauhinia variegata]|uniref:Uncharacterized protein n=1 Tax=Bauhinia variegata TaxID=167791 RepID=A0ACB9NE52_BAUVA|nr:hypothetical protein L6164_013464 [Bauhinia variegata]
MSLKHSTLVFSVQRCQPELISPAKPTPYEIKLLSDIDDQDGLRFQVPFIHFYRHQPEMGGKDPVHVIRQALAQTLVFYYPFAGRIREGPGRKLVVNCTGEGVMFIEAHADVTLDQFGDTLHPPFPRLEELLYDVPGSRGIVNCALLLIQVTRLKCGGFIFAYRLNHSMSDGAGILQFMSAMAEIANGSCAPSIPPVWCRDLLSARNPSRITCTHHEYELLPNVLVTMQNMIYRSFFFGSTEEAAIRRFLPHNLRKSRTFEILTACLWRCRTIALQFNPNEEVRMMFPVNVRAKLNPKLPIGYYGNDFVFVAAVTTARKLCKNPLGYALELVKEAKARVNEEYVHSQADFLFTNGRPHHIVARSFYVTDMKHAEFDRVDFGWGRAIYGGVAKGHSTNFPENSSLYIPLKNAYGENSTLVPICLPVEAMEKFAEELDKMLKNHGFPSSSVENSHLIMSSL